MIRPTLLALAAATAIVTAPVAAMAQGRNDHDDTIIDYVTCDGSQWTARWNGDGFVHTPRSGGPAHYDAILDYQTWDGSCWRVNWDASRGQFFHLPLGGGAGHYDTIMNYLTWNGDRWTATRANAALFHHVGPLGHHDMMGAPQAVSPPPPPVVAQNDPPTAPPPPPSDRPPVSTDCKVNLAKQAFNVGIGFMAVLAHKEAPHVDVDENACDGQ